MTHTSRTRRAAALSALALAGIVALSGCGADASAPETTAAQNPSSPSSEAAPENSAPAEASGLVPAAEGKTTYPLTLETPWGSTELTQRPERIAAVTPSQDDAEILAALGVTPVLANETTTDAFIAEALTQPIPNRFVRGDSPFPIEQIAKAEPDLIVVINTDLTDDYAKLSSVAPVLAITQAEGSEMKIANDWEANVTRIGEVLDLSVAAQAALDKEDAFFEAFRADNPDLAGKSVSYLVYYGDEGGLQFHSSVGSPAAGTFERMGLTTSPGAKDLEYRQEISQELLAAVDADIIVFSDNSNGTHATITEQPLFANLEAVKNDRLILIENRSEEGTFVIDGETYEGNLPWALARSGPLSAPWAAAKLAPALIAAQAR